MRDFEMGKDNLSEEPNNHSGLIGGASESFHPLEHIIHRNEDIPIPSRRWIRAHEIHTPNIKNFNLKNVIERTSFLLDQPPVL